MRPERRSSRAQAVISGWSGDPEAPRRFLVDPDASTRAAALGALARTGRLSPTDLSAAFGDPDPTVRRRAARLAATSDGAATSPLELLDDDDPTVAEEAAFALGERPDSGEAETQALSRMVEHHPDPLCREAAVAAIGAIGHEAGVEAVLAATRDLPAIRRRAALALAPFSGPLVDEALERLATDNDWQVRQAVEDIRSR